MGFLIACNNKGCGQMQSAYLDKETNEAYCSICDRVISNVSDFTKRSMRSLAQYRPKEKETFAVKCAACNKEGRPKLINDQVVCGKCDELVTNLTPFFISMLKEKLNKGGDS
jgi:ribosomal protein L34E